MTNGRGISDMGILKYSDINLSPCHSIHFRNSFTPETCYKKQSPRASIKTYVLRMLLDCEQAFCQATNR